MPNIRHLLRINARPEKVYEAVTTQTGLAGWWTVENTTTAKVGGFAEFHFGDCYHNKMRIAALEPGRRVEWECLEGDAEWIGTTFVFDFEAVEDATRLRFSHNGWREETDFYANCNFHWGFYMQSLKEFCESGEGTPFQTR
jgi:uncharacterized protein YndB with AHSA1/START domain